MLCKKSILLVHGIQIHILCTELRMSCANLKLLTILQKKHRCELEVMETGEHYFHTEEQLKIFEQWLHKHIN